MTPLTDEQFEAGAGIVEGYKFRFNPPARESVERFIADARWHRAELARVKAEIGEASSFTQAVVYANTVLADNLELSKRAVRPKAHQDVERE